MCHFGEFLHLGVRLFSMELVRYISASRVYTLTSFYVALIAILRCSLFLQRNPQRFRASIREALEVYARSPSSQPLMAAVKQHVSAESLSITEADGQELFRLIMAHPLEVTPYPDVQQ
jgi:hypothetical protein